MPGHTTAPSSSSRRKRPPVELRTRAAANRRRPQHALFGKRIDARAEHLASRAGPVAVVAWKSVRSSQKRRDFKRYARALFGHLPENPNQPTPASHCFQTIIWWAVQGSNLRPLPCEGGFWDFPRHPGTQFTYDTCPTLSQNAPPCFRHFLYTKTWQTGSTPSGHEKH